MSTTIARDIQPGQLVRLVSPAPTADSPYAAFRLVERVEPGMYRQTTIQFSDGTWDTWGPNAEFSIGIGWYGRRPFRAEATR